jgi:hypothetical protein
MIRYMKNRWSAFRGIGEKIKVEKRDSILDANAVKDLDLAGLQGAWVDERFEATITGESISIYDTFKVVESYWTAEIKKYSTSLLATLKKDGTPDIKAYLSIDKEGLLDLQIESAIVNYHGKLKRK